jgi:hypothetical protein
LTVSPAAIDRELVVELTANEFLNVETRRPGGSARTRPERTRR